MRIAVDLTPILPGGENGGAKIMTIELLKSLRKIASNCEFILLTNEKSHEELSILDAPNMKRFCAYKSNDDLKKKLSKIQILKNWIEQKLPFPIRIRFVTVLQKMFNKKIKSLLKTLSIDLLFCPFTAPLYFVGDIPVVCVIYDLQFHYYPNFFTKKDRFYRCLFFAHACRVSKRLICISDYVKETIYQNSPKPLTSKQVVTIYIALSDRLASGKNSEEVLSTFGLTKNNYLLYPANFWPHKNHKMLLTAYSIYCRQQTPHLKLVCTGFPSSNMQSLQTAVNIMGLSEAIKFPGFVSDQDFRVLIENCRAVIFPSLYEGFGMPVLEAMSIGKPVLCSNVTSLPEIAGDAALLFDARRPEQIASTIAKIATDDNLIADLVRRGKQRAEKFGDVVKMAEQYLEVFRDVMKEKSRMSDLC